MLHTASKEPLETKQTITDLMTASIQALTPKRSKELEQLCAKLGVHFGRMGLLHEALTHSSYASENAGIKDYERLEFFGDAILKFVISEYLLERFPDYDEGELSQIRAVVVSDKIMAELASGLNLSKYILLGRQLQMKPSIMAESFEALIGAVYIDLGLIHVQNMVVRMFGNTATAVDRDEFKDNFKGELQEIAQGKAQGHPVYEVDHMDGPAHDRMFHVTVTIQGTVLGSGSGTSKRAAEQEAAKAALTAMNETANKKKAKAHPQPSAPVASEPDSDSP
jgi:ribonuclease-3